MVVRLWHMSKCVSACPCALQDGDAESSAGSNDALCLQTPGSAHSATSQPVSSNARGLALTGGTGTAAPVDLHCSASSCCGEPCGKPESGRTLKARAASAAGWFSADGNDESSSSAGSLKGEVICLLGMILKASERIRLRCGSSHSRSCSSPRGGPAVMLGSMATLSA